MNKNIITASVLTVALTLAGSAFAQQAPGQTVSPKRHPNLAAAQKLCDKALEKIEAAQRDNEFDLGGHAAQAKQLLDQADAELKQAAQTSNANGR